MIRLLALDMDGTLLNRHKIVTPAVLETLQELIGQGICVTIATGRFPASAWLHARHVGMNCPLVAFNGAVIVDERDGRLLQGRPLPPAAAGRVAELAAADGVYVHFYGFSTLWVEELNEMNTAWPLANVVVAPDKPLTYASYADQADRIQVKAAGPLAAFAESGSEPLYKATVITEDPVKLRRLYEELKAMGEFTLTWTGSKRFDVNAAGVSKRHGLEELCRMKGIAQAETAAVGDYDNDAEMLRWAGLGIAMGNSNDDIKAVADVVTASNEEDGVAMAVRQYIYTCPPSR